MKWFQAYQTQVEQILPLSLPQPKTQEIPENLLHEALRYSLLGKGKRIRPILGMLCYEICQSPNKLSRETVWQNLISLEMIHAASLVHDDLPGMDNDETRRGQPTVWKKYGTATAILVGDELFIMAFENLAKHAPNNRLRPLTKTLAQGTGKTGMIGGQMRDIYYEFHPFTYHQLLKTHHQKTGALITASGLMGGLLAQAPQTQLDLITTYCEKIGLAFQIKDDLLDREGESHTLGKAIGKDQNKGCLELLGLEKSKNLLNKVTKDAQTIAHKLKSEKLEELAQFIKQREK